jgi:hypothetical protein
VVGPNLVRREGSGLLPLFTIRFSFMQIRLYDIGAQRRPTIMFDYGESPIKSIAPDGDGYTVYVGTGSGDLACFDMRTGEN